MIPAGARVRRVNGSRGTVIASTETRLTVIPDAGGSESAPPHFHTWREISCRIQHKSTSRCLDCEERP